METKNLLTELSKPFDPQYLSWKPGHTTKDGSKCLAMPYADLRAYQERLDQVLGMDWSCRFVPWTNNRIICELTIAGVTRSSTGESNAQDEKNGLGGSVSEAMAFKRACSGFGCGRFLYDLPSVWVEYDAQGKGISKAGQDTLDKRYREWYNRQTQPAQEPAPAPAPATPNGKPPKPAAKPAVKPAEAQNGDETDNPWENGEDTSLERLEKLGVELYGDGWAAKAGELAGHASTGKANNVRDLTEGEILLLISGIEKKLAAKETQEA